MSTRRLIRVIFVASALVVIGLSWMSTSASALPSTWSETDYYDDNGALIGQHYVNCSEPVHNPWWGETSSAYWQETGGCEGGSPVGGDESCIVCFPVGGGLYDCTPTEC
jgi:hypothetical protein